MYAENQSPYPNEIYNNNNNSEIISDNKSNPERLLNINENRSKKSKSRSQSGNGYENEVENEKEIPITYSVKDSHKEGK